MCGIYPVCVRQGVVAVNFLARRAAPGVHQEVVDRRTNRADGSTRWGYAIHEASHEIASDANDAGSEQEPDIEQ
jgi:hypothetical protein